MTLRSIRGLSHIASEFCKALLLRLYRHIHLRTRQHLVGPRGLEAIEVVLIVRAPNALVLTVVVIKVVWRCVAEGDVSSLILIDVLILLDHSR